MSRSGSVLGWALVVGAGLACRSTAPGGPAESTRERLECPARLMAPQTTLTYTLSCEGFAPKDQRLQSGAQVTFVSTCAHPVSLHVGGTGSPFTSGATTIVLKDPGATQVETVGPTGGCHSLCFGAAGCEEDGRDSKTGSLDVHTSGGLEPARP
ncbi:hypothetical protein [Melittangium boletus]|uniref:hypothetical protein n=1 Tax=Melittangium boletus TaxID=83453 RepID=UPI003DA4C506